MFLSLESKESIQRKSFVIFDLDHCGFIMYVGPPRAPNITYNASEGVLCLSAYSHTEFPVLNFTVTVTDATGIDSPLSRTYVNTGEGPLCLNVTSDPVSSVCHPFQVSVTAWNAIGSSPSVNVDMFTQEDPDRGEQLAHQVNLYAVTLFRQFNSIVMPPTYSLYQYQANKG